MKLVYQSTKTEVKVGDVAHTFRGVPVIVCSIQAPHKPSSTGRASVQSMCERKYFADYYPSVINAEWVEQ